MTENEEAEAMTLGLDTQKSDGEGAGPGATRMYLTSASSFLKESGEPTLAPACHRYSELSQQIDRLLEELEVLRRVCLEPIERVEQIEVVLEPGIERISAESSLEAGPALRDLSDAELVHAQQAPRLPRRGVERDGRCGPLTGLRNGLRRLFG